MHWLSILLPTIPAFVGSGVATAAVTHWLTIKRAREELLRTKLEDLFMAVSGYHKQGCNMTLPYLFAMRGEISYDTANDLATKDFDRSSRFYEKAQMLVNLYFPVTLYQGNQKNWQITVATWAPMQRNTSAFKTRDPDRVFIHAGAFSGRLSKILKSLLRQSPFSRRAAKIRKNFQFQRFIKDPYSAPHPLHCDVFHTHIRNNAAASCLLGTK
jgi:hypothetical protein